MIIEVVDNNSEFYYVNSAHVIYLKKRKRYGLWKIVLVNGEHILTDSDGAISKLIRAASEETTRPEVF